MSIEMETSLIGGLMKLKTNESELAGYILSTLKTNSFFSMTNREIYKSIKFLAANNQMFDHLSVSKNMSSHQNVSITDIDRCFQHRGDNSVLKHYTREIKDDSIERHALARVNDLPSMIVDTELGSIQERIGLAESVLSSLLESIQNRKTGGLKDGLELSSKWLDSIEEYNSDSSNLFDFGIESLDEIIAPKMIKPGSLVVIGARPKMGKTFFATKLASHYVNKRDETCCIFSLEMGDIDIYERMLSEQSKVNSNGFYTVPFENTAWWDHVGQSNVNLAHKKIFIDDTPGITIRHIKSETRKVHKVNKVSLLMVDYLTLMEADEKFDSTSIKYGEITKQLKNFAKELGCVVVLLTQLNRGLESRPCKRPVPSDSRDTGQIEQDCDIWIGLYREKVYNDSVPYNFTEAIIRLNRHGESGTGYLTLENGYFENVPTLEAQKQIDAHKSKGDDDEQSRQQSYSKKRYSKS